jgi:hypothetical protein
MASAMPFYGWRTKFGEMQVDDARRLKALEAENAKLEKLLAESMLDSDIVVSAHGMADSCALRVHRYPTKANSTPNLQVPGRCGAKLDVLAWR